MKPTIPFALLALIPAALNTTAASASYLTMTYCTGDGRVHTVQVPMNSQQDPANGQGQCCAKGCHSGSSRKRGCHGEFEPSQ